MTNPVVPPHTSSRRAALLEQLIVALTSDPQNGLPIKTRAPDDPTIALLDAWATVGDVLGFYLDRIADEGYLSTATQAGSIIALASLVGYQPVPGLAAQVYLAYSLAPDPADGAVQFSPGLLFQSVPAPGQQPQTFESAQAIVARPSWNLMTPKSTQPLQPSTTSLVVDSTTTNITPNDVILVEAGTNQYAPVVASATVDYSAKVTNVTLQAPADGSSPPATTPPSAGPQDATAAIDNLLNSGLGKPTTPVPASANQLTQTAQSVFSAGSDAVPRLISALQPAVASTLYAALGSTAIGSPAVTSASVMQVTAAPFGAAAPPQIVFNASGQPAGTRDWPIGDTFTLQLSVSNTDYQQLWNAATGQLTGIVSDYWRAPTSSSSSSPSSSSSSSPSSSSSSSPDEPSLPVIDVQCSTSATTSQGTIEVTGDWPVPTPALSLAGFEVQLQSGAVLTYSGPPNTIQPIQVTPQISGNAVTFTFATTAAASPPNATLGTLTWDPNINTPLTAQILNTQLSLPPIDVTIAWVTPTGEQPVLTFSLATPLPLTNPNVLLLDGNYPGIVQGSYVVINSAEQTGASSSSSSSSSSGSSSSSSSSSPLSSSSSSPSGSSSSSPLPSSSSSSSSSSPFSSSSSSSPLSSSSSSPSGSSSSSSSSSSSAAFDGYPVIATVESTNTVAASGFGITGKVTQLTLNKPWIDNSDVLQSSLRPLIVYAQPAALPLQAAPVTDPNVDGSSLDLDGLVAGMEPGRLIAVTGTRTDVPGATVQSGEIAMVASVSTNADTGGTPYSTLNLANALAYSYQRSTVQIWGNVVSAHQGATINQVLGSGQPAQAPQSFTLSSGPLLADPAPTGSGYQSSLTVTVNGVGYTQVDRVDSSTPAHSFVAGTNASGQTTIVFPAPLPAGTGNISASYRAADATQGNLSAGQITQLLSRPASLNSVTNPLPASGGTGGDDQESVRAAAPVSLSGLGRLVTVSDYADLASSFAGVGKASAAFDPGTGVVVTIAGTNPTQLDSGDSLCLAVAAAIAEVADPALPVQVLPANLYLIALTASVAHDSTVSWDDTVAAVQAALLAHFGYAQRDLGQDVPVSDLLAAAHAAPSVLSFTVTGLALVPAAATAYKLSTILPNLLTASRVPPVATLAAVPVNWGLTPATPTPAAVAYLSDSAPGTLILSEQSP